MGKKGKRSKRGQAKKVNTARTVIDNIFNRVNENFNRERKSSSKRLHSDAISTLKEALQFIEAKEAIIVKAGKELDCHLVYEGLITQTYSKLIVFEYNSCNYEEVIQMYNCFTLKFNRATVHKMVTRSTYIKEFILRIKMYRDLALIRLGNNVCADSVIFQDTTNYMSKADRDNATRCKKHIVSCMRVSKNFSAAIDTDRQFASIRNLDEEEELQLAASLAVTYMERYRVEFHKHTKKENEQEFVRLTKFINDSIPEYEWGSLSCNIELQLSHAIALAQWNYLFSKTLKKEDKMWTGARRQAIYYIRYFIGAKWQLKDICFYCHQAPTKDEVKYVCGDCRVACYCSIDHQRASWKKNALQDMCFGHEAICPAMKAYRRWQEAVDSGDIERVKKMERRLGRECLGFLAYGLGLEDKWYDSYDREEVESG